VEAVKMERSSLFSDRRFAQIKKEIIKDADFMWEFYWTDEAFDIAMKARSINEALARPNLTLSRRKLEEEWADMIGLSGKRFQKTDEEIQQEQMQQQMVMQQEQPQGAMAIQQGQANRLS
jgi:hypothetical protein